MKGLTLIVFIRKKMAWKVGFCTSFLLLMKTIGVRLCLLFWKSNMSEKIYLPLNKSLYSFLFEI